MSTEELVRALLSQLEQVDAQIRQLTDVQRGLRSVIAFNQSLAQGGGQQAPTPVATSDASALALGSPTDTDEAGQRQRPLNPVVREIKRVLEEEGSPMHTRAIYERVRARKVYVGGSDPVNNISSFLSRNRELFENVGRGVWGLQEWMSQTNPAPEAADIETSEGETAKATGETPETPETSVGAEHVRVPQSASPTADEWDGWDRLDETIRPAGDVTLAPDDDDDVPF